VTTHAKLDYKIREESRIFFSNNKVRPNLDHILKIENGKLAYIQLQADLIYYYIVYDEAERRFEWIQVDYNDRIRPMLSEIGLTFSDLPYDGAGFDAMKRSAICTGIK